MGMTAEQYALQQRQLLPPGRLWTTDTDSVLWKVFLACADEYARVDTRARDLLNEWDPRTASEMLPDWEKLLGLSGSGLTTAQRRNNCLQKLISRGGQSKAFYIALAAALGLTITIDEFQYPIPRSGTAQAGLAIAYGSEWAHVWTVNVPLTGRTADSSGNSRNLTENGSVGMGSSTVSAFGKTAAFTAAGGYFSRNGDDFNFNGTSPFTVELFVTPNNSPGGNRTIIGRGTSAGAPSTVNWQLMFLSTMAPRFQIRNAGGSAALVNGTALSVGTRYHLAGVYDGSLMSLYVNGASVGTPATVFGGAANVLSLDLAIGTDGTNKIFADVDEVRISNIARYTSGFAVPSTEFTADANTVALYHFGLAQQTLESLIQLAKPAHTKVVFNYT
jgi:uncharacterized protein YmfQ (DUF2313 family)